MSNLIERVAAHPVSFKSTRFMGASGKEVFITLRTKDCDWRKKTGGCACCALGGLDGQNPPLGLREAELQVEGSIRELTAMGEDPAHVIRVSLISMSDSLFNPETIELDALKRVLEIIRRAFPNIRIISVESRADYALSRFSVLSEVSEHITSVFHPLIFKEVACGIETPFESEREKLRKGITNKNIETLSITLCDAGWNQLRGFFIYNLFGEDTPEERLYSLRSSVDFMRRFIHPSVRPSILVTRAYVPKEKATLPLFRRFKEVDDETALRELREAVEYAAKMRVELEFDTTYADQIAVSAGVMSPVCRAKLDRYNLTHNPDELR